MRIPNGYPPPPPRPHPQVVLTGDASASIQNGQTVTLQFTVLRHHATKAISLSADWLPQGVSATFSPASLPSAATDQQFSLSLTAAVDAFAGQTTIQVTAVTTGAESGYAWVDLNLVSPFSFVPGADILAIGTGSVVTQFSQTEVRLAAFGQATIPLNLQIGLDIVGTVSIDTPSGLPTGVAARANPPSFGAPPQPGYVAVELVLTAGASLNAAKVSVTFGVTSGAELRGTFTFPLELMGTFVTSVTPLSGRVPMLGQDGTQVTVVGGGLGPGTTVKFGDDSPVAPSSFAPDGTSLVVSVPPTAASGQLSVISPAGVVPGIHAFAVDNFRNTRGFAWANMSFQSAVGGSWTFEDATALFGAEATNIDVFGWLVANPLVYTFLSIANLMLDGHGQCFGTALASLRFAAGQVAFSGFPQRPTNVEPNGPSGPDAWLLEGPHPDGTDASPSLAAYVHQQHLAQLSQDWINSWLVAHELVNPWSSVGLRTAIQAFLKEGPSGVGALISLNPDYLGTGHAVVAYEVVDTGGGGFDVLVYNSNAPFDAQEDTDTKARADARNNSVIHVMNDGSWTFPELGYAGGIFNIAAVPWTVMSLVPPSIPWAELYVAGALASVAIWIVVGDADVRQVSDGQGHLLLAGGQWNTNPATKLPGVRPMPALGGLGGSSIPAFVSNKPGPLIHTITGKAAGAYDLHWLGGGHSLTLSGVTITPESSDTALINTGRIDFTPGQDKAVTTTLTGTGSVSGIPRTAVLKTSASAGKSLGLWFDRVGESFSYVHKGASTKYTLELSSFDAQGKPTTFVAPQATVRAGEMHTYRPDWRQLGVGIGIVSVQTAAGAVVNRPLTQS